MSPKCGVSLLRLVTITTLLLTALSCSSERRPERFTIGGATSLPLILPTLLAITNGHFAKEGLEPPRIQEGSGTRVRTSLLSKDLDFALLAFVHTPLARLQGQTLKILLSTHDREIYSLIVRQQYRAVINEVSDLKGYRIGVTRPGSGSWALATAYLSASRLDPERDVSLVTLGDDLAAIYSAIVTGTVDAFPSWEPLTTRALDDGLAYSLIDISDPKQHQQWIGSATALSQTLVSREDFIRDNHELVRRVIRAHKRALADIRNTSGKAVAERLFADSRSQSYLSGLSLDQAARVIERLRPGFGTGVPSELAYRVSLRLARDSKTIDRDVSFAEAVDQSFAQ